MSSIYDWSLTPIENSSIDSAINWKENQVAGDINDSARAMMARIKEYIVDLSGSIENEFETVRGDTFITITPQSYIKKYSHGLTFRFQATGNNNHDTYIKIQGLEPIRVMKPAIMGSVPLTGGEIMRGGIYEITYYVTYDMVNNIKTDRCYWHLMNPTPVYTPPVETKRLFPVGTIGAFAMRAVPRNWLVCDGRAVSRHQYKNLLDVIGLEYGIGDGVNTFNIPDYRGVFLRGYDAGRGLDRNRAFGDIQQDAFKFHSHEGVTGRANYSRGQDDIEPSTSKIIQDLLSSMIDKSSDDNSELFKAKWYEIPNERRHEIAEKLKQVFQHSHNISTGLEGGSETRPINVSVIYAIHT